MRIFDVAIVGGGASGLMAAVHLQTLGIKNIILFDSNERLGRKLAATGNGQGNISNLNLTEKNYFSSNYQVVQTVLKTFTVQNLIDFFKKNGLYVQADKVGRLYPLSRQASSVTDCLRFCIEKDLTVLLNTKVTDILLNRHFVVCTQGQNFAAKIVILATGGLAASNLGSDGFGYIVAKKFGHTVTNLTPSITRLVVQNSSIAGLKGVRVNVKLSLIRSGRVIVQVVGDIVFADSTIGGDSVYKISAFYQNGDALLVDFLPDLTTDEVKNFLQEQFTIKKQKNIEGVLKGLLHGSIARFLLKQQNNYNIERLAKQIKNYKIAIQKTAPFDIAQVTKGGVNMQEIENTLMSKKCKNLYLIGELLDCDGECGGYNLQWAFSSGVTAAKAIANNLTKGNI